MAFADKYQVQALPVVKRGAQAPISPEERARGKLLAAMETQHQLLAAELKGKTYTVKRNGKQMAPRAFWISTAAGVAFTPRFGNQFLFEKGQGVLADDLNALAQVLTDFQEAVKAGEFDAQLMSIAQSRGSRSPGSQAGMGIKRGRGRPKGS